MSGHRNGNAIRLNDENLAELSQRGVSTPTYDRERLRPRIAHIGVGGFHRAHLAVYCERLAALGSEWGICGIGLLDGDRAMAEVLDAQDYLYTFTERGDGAPVSTIIGSIIDFVLAAGDTTSAVERLADESTAIVSMTITEAGYDDTDRSRATFDVIAAGLARRQANGHGGVTILSCDNLQGNGDAARRCVRAACDRVSPSLTAWVEGQCTFPNSMVDRITPVTSDADRDHLHQAFGFIDRWPVVGEPFMQWIVEDDFAAGRPDFEAAGALYTDDVHSWEHYKLRLLNAGHSAIAYVSALAGITHVDEAIATPELHGFLRDFLLLEAVPTLQPIVGHPPQDYAATVLNRFANTGVRDQIKRLCVDGTSKLPTFVMPTIVQQLALNGPIDRSTYALAAWARYLAEVPVAEQAADALGDEPRRLALAAVNDPLVFIDEQAGFLPELAADERFRRTFTDAYRAIADLGPIKALQAAVGT